MHNLGYAFLCCFYYGTFFLSIFRMDRKRMLLYADIYFSCRSGVNLLTIFLFYSYDDFPCIMLTLSTPYLLYVNRNFQFFRVFIANFLVFFLSGGDFISRNLIFFLA
jgi:hypothetical protein